VDWLLLLLGELLCVVDCRRSRLIVFGGAVVCLLVVTCCNFCFVLLSWPGMWGV
jgi:hypothetical protein